MKTFPTRILPAFLLFFCWASSGRAQQPAPNPPPPDQNPPQQPAPNPPPPDQNTPQQQPSTGPGIRRVPPPMPKVPDVRQPGERGFWLGVTMWFPVQGPVFDKGHAATFTDPSRLTMQGKPKYAEGAEIGIALGLHNSLHISYFQDSAAGTFTNAQEIQVWNQVYTAGNLVSTNYKLRTVKASFDFLTWPYPVESRKFRLHTLWGVQYTTIKTGFDLPLLPLVDSAGNPITDASGNAVDYSTSGTKSLVLPSFGIGLSQYLSRHVRLEGNASGFAIPHHATTWDADASLNLRAGHWELRVGAKALHFKTSTKADFFLRGTQTSGFVGLRWYSD